MRHHLLISSVIFIHSVAMFCYSCRKRVLLVCMGSGVATVAARQPGEFQNPHLQNLVTEWMNSALHIQGVSIFCYSNF